MGTEVLQGEAGCRKEFKIVLCAELAETGYSRSVCAPGGRCNSKQLQAASVSVRSLSAAQG